MQCNTDSIRCSKQRPLTLTTTGPYIRRNKKKSAGRNGMRIFRLRYLATLLALFGPSFISIVSANAATDWPRKEITLINNFPPGSATELTARAIARNIEKTLGVTVVVKSIPGAAGQLGPAELARSAPDGYTMGLVGSSTYLTAPHMMDVPFKAWDAFDLIAQATELRYGIGVAKNSPITSIEDMIAKSKQKRLTYSSTSPNNVLPMFQLNKFNGANLRWIVFAGGSESVLQAVGGHVDITLQSYTEMKPQLDSGALRLLASTSLHLQTRFGARASHLQIQAGHSGLHPGLGQTCDICGYWRTLRAGNDAQRRCRGTGRRRCASDSDRCAKWPRPAHGR